MSHLQRLVHTYVWVHKAKFHVLFFVLLLMITLFYLFSKCLAHGICSGSHYRILLEKLENIDKKENNPQLSYHLERTTVFVTYDSNLLSRHIQCICIKNGIILYVLFCYLRIGRQHFSMSLWILIWHHFKCCTIFHYTSVQ